MKPSAPPAPPRRHASGIRNPDEQQPPTQNYAGQQYGEPPTMAAARARIHEIARELPAENRFPADSHDYNNRGNYNDETQGRIEQSDLAAAHAAYDRQYGAPSADAYDQLPALNGPESYYPGEQHDPMTALRPAYDEVLQQHANHYRSDRPLPEDDSSGEYARRRNSPSPLPAPNSYDASAYEASYPKGRREEPSFADAPPRAERSFRRDDFPRENSYRDEPRREDRGNSYRREERDEPRAEKSYRREERSERSSYQPPRNDETRAEGSSAKHDAKPTGGIGGADSRSARESSWSKNEPSIPGPARVPAELRVPDNFVVGVQPIRTPSMGSSAAGQMPSFPQPQAIITPSAYGPPAVTGAASAMPHITMPPMMAPMAPMTAPMAASPLHMPPVTGGMHVRAHTSARPGGHVPQMTELEEASQGSKVGRFAWFVFGAAFGIFFAFAATGFGFGGKKDEPAAGNFPPAPSQLAPAPVQTQPPVEQPAPQQPIVQQQPPMVPQQQPMMQPPVQQQPMMQPPVQQQPMMQPQQVAPPVGQVPAPPPGVLVAPNQNVGPIVPAQQPVQQPQQAQPANNGRGQQARPAPAPRRPAAPPRANTSRPSAINNGVGGDDDAPAPSKKSSAAEPNVADLLGDGLGK